MYIERENLYCGDVRFRACVVVSGDGRNRYVKVVFVQRVRMIDNGFGSVPCVECKDGYPVHVDKIYTVDDASMFEHVAPHYKSIGAHDFSECPFADNRDVVHLRIAFSNALFRKYLTGIRIINEFNYTGYSVFYVYVTGCEPRFLVKYVNGEYMNNRITRVYDLLNDIYIYNDDNGVSYKVGNEYKTVLSIVRNVFKKHMFERFENRCCNSYFVY